MIWRGADGDFYVMGKAMTKAERVAAKLPGAELTSMAIIKVSKKELLAAVNSDEIGKIAMRRLTEMLGELIAQDLEQR